MQHSELFLDEWSVIDLQIFESKNFVHLFWYIRGGVIFKNEVQKSLVPLDLFSSNTVFVRFSQTIKILFSDMGGAMYKNL